jgi:hypothetical protein
MDISRQMPGHNHSIWISPENCLTTTTVYGYLQTKVWPQLPSSKSFCTHNSLICWDHSYQCIN